MDAERICEEGNEQLSASDSVEVLEEETNGNMDASDMESNVTIISTGTTVLLWDEKVKMSSGITVIIWTKNKGKQAD